MVGSDIEIDTKIKCLEAKVRSKDDTATVR